MARGQWGGTGQIHPLRVRISFFLGPVRAQTGFTLRDQSLTPSNPQAAAEHVAEWVNDSLRPHFWTGDRFDGVDVLDMVTGEGGGHSFNNVTGSGSVTAADLQPSFMQVPISLKGELRRRYGQGRMLFPVRFENMQDGGTLSTTGIAQLTAVATSLTTRYLGDAPLNTYRLINVHGVIPPKAPTASGPGRAEVPASWYDVTSIRFSNVLSFVRSRKLGVGP